MGASLVTVGRAPVLITPCCITNPLVTSVVNVLPHRVSGVRNLGAGEFQLEVSRELAVKMQVRAEPSEGSCGAGRSSCEMGPSHGCWPEGQIRLALDRRAYQLLAGDPLTAPLKCPHCVTAGFLTVSDPRGRDHEGGHWAFHDLVSGATHHLFQNVLFLRKESLKLNPRPGSEGTGKSGSTSSRKEHPGTRGHSFKTSSLLQESPEYEAGKLENRLAEGQQFQ